MNPEYSKLLLFVGALALVVLVLALGCTRYRCRICKKMFALKYQSVYCGGDALGGMHRGALYFRTCRFCGVEEKKKVHYDVPSVSHEWRTV